MMNPILGPLIGALALLASARGLEAQPVAPPAASGAPIADLLGLDAAGVRARLFKVPDDWPVPRALEILAPNGVMTFITVSDLMTDPALARRNALFRTQGDPTPQEPSLACAAFLSRPGAAQESAASIVLVFHDGRLEAGLKPVERATRSPAPPMTSANAWIAAVRQPISSPFIGRPGALPLEDGLDFMARWPNAALGPEDRLKATCSPSPPPRPVRASPHHGLDAGDLQGLSLLPFALALPALNRQRVLARREGAALLAALHAGEPLGASPQTFAETHRGVRAYPGAQADDFVLSLDLGGYPGRNLSNFNDAALVGVRRGIIVWIAPPADFGPRPSLLCRDEAGAPSARRRGCSRWGQFTP